MATKAIPQQESDRLRPYQHSAVEAAISGIQAGQPGLLVMPTGSGKSVVISEIVNRLDGKQILVITPRRSLLMQTRTRLGVHGVLSSGLGNDLGDDHKVIAGTYQTMTRRRLRIKPTSSHQDSASGFVSALLCDTNKPPEPSRQGLLQ